MRALIVTTLCALVVSAGDVRADESLRISRPQDQINQSGSKPLEINTFAPFKSPAFGVQSTMGAVKLPTCAVELPTRAVESASSSAQSCCTSEAEPSSANSKQARLTASTTGGACCSSEREGYSAAKGNCCSSDEHHFSSALASPSEHFGMWLKMSIYPTLCHTVLCRRQCALNGYESCNALGVKRSILLDSVRSDGGFGAGGCQSVSLEQ